MYIIYHIGINSILFVRHSMSKGHNFVELIYITYQINYLPAVHTLWR